MDSGSYDSGWSPVAEVWYALPFTSNRRRTTKLHTFTSSPPHPSFTASLPALPSMHLQTTFIISPVVFYGRFRGVHSLTLNMEFPVLLGLFWPSNSRHRHISFLQLHDQHVKMQHAEINGYYLRLEELSMEESEVESTDQNTQVDGSVEGRTGHVGQDADDEEGLVQGLEIHEYQVSLIGM